MDDLDARSFGAFLGRSLDEVRADVPLAWARLRAALGGRDVLFVVDAEPVLLRADARGLGLLRGAAVAETLATRRPDVAVRTTRAAILRMVDGETTLARAVLAGAFDLVGRLDDLLAFDGALRAYLHGAVRSPAQPSLLRAWRADEAAPLPDHSVR